MVAVLHNTLIILKRCADTKNWLQDFITIKEMSSAHEIAELAVFRKCFWTGVCVIFIKMRIFITSALSADRIHWKKRREYLVPLQGCWGGSGYANFYLERYNCWQYNFEASVLIGRESYFSDSHIILFVPEEQIDWIKNSQNAVDRKAQFSSLIVAGDEYEFIQSKIGNYAWNYLFPI